LEYEERSEEIAHCGHMDIDSGRQITTVMMTIVMRKQRMAEVMTTTAVVSSASIGWRAPSSGSGKNTRSHHKVP